MGHDELHCGFDWLISRWWLWMGGMKAEAGGSVKKEH